MTEDRGLVSISAVPRWPMQGQYLKNKISFATSFSLKPSEYASLKYVIFNLLNQVIIYVTFYYF
jgi:hypothetical protein